MRVERKEKIKGRRRREKQKETIVERESEM